MAELPLRLDGKVAMVTGGSQGIGKALAFGLAQAGAAVAVADLPAKQRAAEQVCQEVSQRGATARAYSSMS